MPMSSRSHRGGWTAVLSTILLDQHLRLTSLWHPTLLSFSCRTEASRQRLLQNLLSGILVDHLSNFVVKVLQLVLGAFSHIQHLKVKVILIPIILTGSILDQRIKILRKFSQFAQKPLAFLKYLMILRILLELVLWIDQFDLDLVYYFFWGLDLTHHQILNIFFLTLCHFLRFLGFCLLATFAAL